MNKLKKYIKVTAGVFVAIMTLIGVICFMLWSCSALAGVSEIAAFVLGVFYFSAVLTLCALVDYD